MASFKYIFFSLLLTLHLAGATAVTPPRQHGLAIIKDNTLNQYYSTFIIGNPPVVFSLLLDLGNLYSWADCDALNYKSTTFHPIPCGSTLCSAYNGCGCTTTNTCAAYAYTPWTKNPLHSTTNLIKDTIFLYTLPKNSSKVLQYPMPSFPFGCTTSDKKAPLKGMSPNAKGILTLANVNIAFHSIISKAFKVPQKFSLCLPSTNTILYRGFQGALYVGGGPYYMSKESRHIDFSKSLTTTSIVAVEGVDYYINVKGVEVGGEAIKIETLSLLTKFSTLEPYTVLHRTLYKAVVEVFTAKAKAMNIPRVSPVGPFGACYDSRFMANTTSGPRVPIVDFVFDGSNPNPNPNPNEANKWRVYGANLMVKFFDVKYENVLCLGFVDGGMKTMTSIVVGGKQMEDNVVEFDVESNKVGVTSDPVRLGLSCSQFQSTLPTF